MTFLHIADLEAWYGDVQVLRGIDVSVTEGSVSVMLGANGAGKTTTLRAITGMVRTRGTITLDGVSLIGRRTESIAELGVAHVPQGRGTFTDLTVEDNLRAGGHRLDKDALASGIDFSYDMFPRLGERRAQIAAGLSGGEQQMLAIARALISGPRLLLLDEPSLGLAPKITQGVFEVLRSINKELGTTVLVVEQNAQLALRIGDTASVIESGRTVVSGSATELQGDDEVRRAYLGF